jgi:uncharacterized protein
MHSTTSHPKPGWRRRWVAGIVGLAMTLAACADDSDGDAAGDIDELVANAASAGWDVRPGVELVTVKGAEAGQPLTLYDASGQQLMAMTADEAGRAHFAYVPDEPTEVTPTEVGLVDGHTLRPGEYVIRDDSADPPLASEPFVVLDRDDVPDEALYDEQDLEGVDLDPLGNPAEGVELTDGFQYLEMRDGVTLSAMVRFPDRGLYGDAPWPTVIEYSGYGPSNPDSEEPGSLMARALGYATVSVNLRGTGCSGGVFETFNPAQIADGYDVVEIVARQPWVLHNHVGMVGLSYSGITQLYTAATQPPSLAAVTAQSVIADPWLQAWPQGIYNDGFTRQWLEEREAQSAPGGRDWVQDRIDEGDTVCRENVAEHELNLDFAAFSRSLEMRPPDADDRDLRALVRDIETAVFVSGAFQDEQTGAQFGSLLDKFDNAATLEVRLWNGRHPDGYSTMNVVDLYEFLELYVAERVPQFPPALRDVVANLVAGEFGFSEGELAPDRLHDRFDDDYEAALAFYEDQDPVRVVLGSGLGTDEIGAPGGVAEVELPSWPPPDAEAVTWYLGAEGVLDADEPDGGEGGDEETFTFDPEAGSVAVLADEYSTLAPLPEFDWTPFPDGKSLTYETEPLEDDLFVAGPGYVDLYLGVDSPDADVQVALSEVRSDGVEHLVQNGWLRLGHRAVDEERSTEFEVGRLFTSEVYEPVPDDELVHARVEIPAVGHVFEEGSTLRLTIGSPGRNHVTWTFEPPEGVDGDTTYRVGLGAEQPSSLVLPVIDVDVAGMPEEVPCPGLRGIPCRDAPPVR